MQQSIRNSINLANGVQHMLLCAWPKHAQFALASILRNTILKIQYKTLTLHSKNHLARNIQVLQIDVLQNLASLALKMKLYIYYILSRYKNSCKNLARKNCKTICCKIWSKSCKKSIFQFFLATFLKGFLYLAKKLHFVQYLQDMFKI